MEIQVGIRELKQNPSKVLEKVKAGDEVFIAERGVRVARITKIQKGLLDELVESGEVESPTGDMKASLNSLKRATLPPGAESIAQWLATSRGYDS
jgi:prevent-host-death family protein